MKVGIIMGSKSDLDTMKKASAVLDEFNIPYEMVIASAHRTPEAVKDFVTRLEDEGAIAFIAGAGAAAHLPYVQYRKDMAEKVLADNAELQGAIKL